MSTVVVRQIGYKSTSEAKNAAVSFVSVLSSTEVFTGTPTVAEITTTALTLDNKVVSTAALTINGATVPIGQAIQFRVAGGTAGNTYKVKVTGVTNSSPAQTLVAIVNIEVEGET